MSPARTPRSDDPRDEPPRHPSYDPSGAEPAGASNGRGDSFAGNEPAEAESDRARNRRESMSTRDNTTLGPHDQDFSEGPRTTDKVDVPIRTDSPREEQAPRRATNDREETDEAR